MISRTNIVLAVLLMVVVVTVMASRVDYSQPNYEIALPADMRRSPAYGAYAPNENFVNGRTLQAPVPGTIARGETPLRYAATPEDAIRAGEELRNPYDMSEFETQEVPVPEGGQAGADAAPPASGETVDAAPEESAGDEAAGDEAAGDEAAGDEAAGDEAAGDEATAEEEIADESTQDSTAETAVDDESKRAAEARQRLVASVQRGSDIFRAFCTSCHGPSGAGDGVVPQRGFPPPPSLLTGKSPQMKDGQLFHILTYGQGNMTPFAAQLSPERRWDVINYVRDLQQGAAASLPAAPATEGALSPTDATVVETEPQ